MSLEKRTEMDVFPDTQAPFFFCYVLFVFSWLYMKPAQSTTVGPVERVRGIKNKDINPVCLSLSLSREVRLRFARLPLRPLCLSWDTLCLFVEAGPSRAASAQCVCAAALIYKYLPSWKEGPHASTSVILGSKFLRNILTQTVSWSQRVTWGSTVAQPYCKPQKSSTTVQFDVNILCNTFKHILYFVMLALELVPEAQWIRFFFYGDTCLTWLQYRCENVCLWWPLYIKFNLTIQVVLKKLNYLKWGSYCV